MIRRRRPGLRLATEPESRSSCRRPVAGASARAESESRASARVTVTVRAELTESAFKLDFNRTAGGPSSISGKIKAHRGRLRIRRTGALRRAVADCSLRTVIVTIQVWSETLLKNMDTSVDVHLFETDGKNMEFKSTFSIDQSM